MLFVRAILAYILLTTSSVSYYILRDPRRFHLEALHQYGTAPGLTDIKAT
jgi:hypothetical protein